jgi:hypothetical protein
MTVSFQLKEAYRLKGCEVRNLRIKKEDGLYYAIFTVEAEVPEKKHIKNIIGYVIYYVN